MKNKNIVVSGIQPSGELHIGNYLGALKNFISLQKNYRCYFFIADLHSLTNTPSAKIKQEQIINLAADFIALGLNPKKATLFIQSQVPAHSELMWLLSVLTPYAELKRMTQFKDKTQKQPENINLGLLAYPVLQAADILLYQANQVPVGKDQIQHLEITRQLARIFNKKYGPLFTEPQPLLTPTENIMSLLNPDKKMSKSHGEGSYLALSDSPEVIRQKIARAVTDTNGKNETMSSGVSNLFVLLKNFSSPAVYKKFEAAYRDQNISYKNLKEQIANDLTNYFATYRETKKRLLAQPEKLLKIFSLGGKKANAVADKTLAEVKKLMGLPNR